MRKRRNLADKLMIMMCAVLIAVSAFFYAPMEVEAAESVYNVSLSDSSDLEDVSENDLIEMFSGDSSVDMSLVSNNNHFNNGYFRFNTDAGNELGSVDLSDYFDLVPGRFYSVDVTISYNLSLSRSVVLYPCIFNLSNGSTVYRISQLLYSESGPSTTFVKEDTSTIYFSSDDSVLDILFYIVTSSGSDASVSYNINTDISFSNLKPFSNADSDEYQNGYNAGYSAGEQAGYGNGYSQGFTDGEASVDTNEIYNQGFNAGKDSVDTQSYYDAGYQAGYQVAYQEGYDSGYDEGYQSAMDRIDGWGADTTDYPVLLDSFNTSNFSDWTAVTSNYPTNVTLDYWVYYDLKFNSNHVYRFDLEFNGLYLHENYLADDVLYDTPIMFCNIGGLFFPLRGTSDCKESYIVSGDRMSSSLQILWTIQNCYILEELGVGEIGYEFKDFSVKLYDLGPSGDTQNHIANQTDSLTNGFNDSHGNSVNNEFSSGLNDFETAEDSLFATATTGLKDFTFFDIQSVPAMVTGMSFVGSIMSGWFAQAGGASGVGIVLSILFSIMLVAMVLGLYRWYQSKGGKD